MNIANQRLSQFDKTLEFAVLNMTAPATNKKNNKMTTSQKLELVLTAQGQRAIAYTKWEETFRRLLNEEINDDKYLEIIQDLMKQFQSVSNSMRETAEYFDSKNLKKLSKFIRNLQELEKQKMNLTMEMQQKILIARPNKHEQKCQHNHHDAHNHIIWRPRLYQEKQKYAEIIEQINDLLAEIKELKNDLKTSQQIVINGMTIQIQTNDDCKTKDLTTSKQ